MPRGDELREEFRFWIETMMSTIWDTGAVVAEAPRTTTMTRKTAAG